MNNLTIAVIVIAVAQALTILLIIGREREIKRLCELVTEQRIQIAEIKAWLAERIQSAPPRRIKPDREPMSEPIADAVKVPEPAITPKDLPDTIPPPITEDETQVDATKRLTKATNWLKEDADKGRELIAFLSGTPPEKAHDIGVELERAVAGVKPNVRD
jgi:hypothetical protein